MNFCGRQSVGLHFDFIFLSIGVKVIKLEIAKGVCFQRSDNSCVTEQRTRHIDDENSGEATLSAFFGHVK